VPPATRGRFLSGVSLQSLGRGGQALAAFATILILAAALDTPALGLYGVYETLFAFVEVLVDGGSGNALVRRGGRRPASLRPALSQAFRFRIATIVLGAAVVFGYAALDPLVVASHPGLVLCVAALAAHLATARAAVFQLQLRFAAPAAIRFATALAVLAVIAAMVAAGVRDPLSLLAGAHLARAAGNLGLGAASSRLLSQWPRQGRPEAGFVRECLALGAGAVVREAYGRIDLILIRALLGAAAAGLYTPARKLFHLSLQLPSFIGVVAMPALAAESADPDRQRQTTLRLARRMALFSLPAAALATFLTPWFVGLAFGPDFAATVLPLQILAWAAALVFPGSLLTTGMIAAGAARQALNLALAILAVAALSNPILISTHALAGAATARLLTEAAALIGARRSFRPNPQPPTSTP